jgi:competence protein ComEC
MVLGIPHAVSTDLEDAFRRSGTIHILVVSGWHMSYIADRIRRAFLSISIPRNVALRTAIACVIAFTLLVGLTAPAVRGALVAIALAFIGLVGRVANPLRILLLVATAMVAVHPHILGFDLAFQLTVAATAAIILGQPIAERLLPCRSPFLREFRDLITASIAASLVTAPLIASAFGAVALLGPFIGIIVLPLSAAVIPTGAIFLAVSAALPFAAPPIAWALSAFSDAIVQSVEWTASLPWAQLPAPRFDGWFIAGVYLLILAAVLQWYRRHGIPILSPFAFHEIRDHLHVSTAADLPTASER